MRRTRRRFAALQAQMDTLVESLEAPPQPAADPVPDPPPPPMPLMSDQEVVDRMLRLKQLEELYLSIDKPLSWLAEVKRERLKAIVGAELREARHTVSQALFQLERAVGHL